jgi:hypothetical protein
MNDPWHPGNIGSLVQRGLHGVDLILAEGGIVVRYESIPECACALAGCSTCVGRRENIALPPSTPDRKNDLDSKERS